MIWYMDNLATYLTALLLTAAAIVGTYMVLGLIYKIVEQLVKRIRK